MAQDEGSERPTVVMTTVGGSITHADPQASALLGRGAAELLGSPLRELVRAADRATIDAALERLRSGAASYEVHELTLRVDDRSQQVCAQFSAQFSAEHGEAADGPVIVLLEDLDQARTAESQRDYRRTLTRIAGQVARLGGWSIEAGTGQVRWSPELFDILEFAGPEPPGFDEGIDLYEDPDVLRAAVEACLVDGVPFDVEVAMRTGRGRPMWARVAGEAHRGPDGAIVRCVGAFQDITASHDAAWRSSQLSERLVATMEATSDGIYLLDDDWVFTYVNSRAEELLQRRREQLLGGVVWELFPETVVTPLHEAYHRVIETGEAVTLDEFGYPPLATWFEVTAYPATDGIAVYFRDVGERVARARDLQRMAHDQQEAADRLRELDRIKNAFLSAVSHELRTPLTVVQGMGQTLQRLRGRLPDAQRADIEDAIVAHAVRLEQLLTDLLDVDRLSRGTFTSRQEPCDVAAIVAATAREASEGAIDLVVDVPPSLEVVADASQIERIVANLVQNSAKYAPGGEVSVRVGIRAGGGWQLDVIDDGPGIPEDELTTVFQPLYRLDDDSPTPGTGIGLSLVRAFAELHGGVARALPHEHGAHVQVVLPGGPQPPD